MKQYLAVAMAALLGCQTGAEVRLDGEVISIKGSKGKYTTHETKTDPATGKQVSTTKTIVIGEEALKEAAKAATSFKIPYLEARLEMAELKAKALDAMYDKLEGLLETNPKFVEAYCRAFSKLYKKAATLVPTEKGYGKLDEGRIKTADAIADCLLGEETEPQTAYVVYSSGFAEKHGIPLPKTLADVEKLLKAEYVFGEFEGTRTERKTRQKCELCARSGTDIAGIYNLHPTATCMSNDTMVQPDPNNPFSRRPGKGPHKVITVVDSELYYVRIGGKEYQYSTPHGIVRGDLVIGSGSSVVKFPSSEAARTCQSLLEELK